MELKDGSCRMGVEQQEDFSASSNNVTDKWVLSQGMSGLGADPSNGTSPPFSQVLHSIDPDELFFKSLLPDVQLLGPQQKGVFKLKVQQLLQEKLFPKECDCSVNSDNGRSCAVTHPSQPNHITAGGAYGTYGVFSDRWSNGTNVGVTFCEYKSN